MTATGAEAVMGTVDRSAIPTGSIAEAPVTLRAGGWVVAAAAILLGALATWNSAHKSMWIDEAYSEYTTRLPLWAAARRSLVYELQPPLYFSLLDLWRHIDHGVMFGRALSTLAAMALVVVMAAIGRRVGLVRWPWLGIAAACVPGVVWAASELRGYALGLLLAALVLYFFVGILSGSERAAPRDAIGYVASATALLFTLYYGGFTLAGQWFAALIARRRVALLTVSLAIVGCTLVPMVPTILTQIAGHPDDVVRIDLAAHPRYAIFKAVGTIIDAFQGRADIVSWAHAISVILAIAIGVPILRSVAGRQPWDREEAALTVVAAVPLVVLGTFRLFDVIPVHPPHFLVTLPGLLLIYAVWLHRLAAGWPRTVAGGAVAAIIFVSLVNYERHGVQREDWRGAASYVAAHAEPGDAVLIYDPDRALPFDDYFFVPASSHIPVYGVPVDMNLERYEPFSYAIRDTAVVAARLRSLGVLDRALWFVTATQLLEPLARSPAVVINYLSAHGRLDRPVSLDGVSIIHAQPVDAVSGPDNERPAASDASADARKKARR